MKKTIETTMIRYSHALILLPVFLISLLADAQQVMNPVWPRNWPDPTIWKADDGRYYCISTNPRRCLVSEDLFHWQITDISPIDEASW